MTNNAKNELCKIGAILGFVIGILLFLILIVSPLGLGWNPLRGDIVITTTQYETIPITIENVGYWASENKYVIYCNSNITYTVSKEMYNSLHPELHI